MLSGHKRARSGTACLLSTKNKKTNTNRQVGLHSGDEIACVAYVLDTISQRQVSHLDAALRRGDALGKYDAVLSIGDHNDQDVVHKVVLEYDGGYFHTKERLGPDVQKTERVLSHHTDLYIVRLRVGPAPLPEMPARLQRHPRCQIVPVRSNCPRVAATHAIRALQRWGLIPGSQCTRSSPTQPAAPDQAPVRHHAEHVIQEFYAQKVQMYRDGLYQLRACFGTEHTTSLLSTYPALHASLQRDSNYADALVKLNEEVFEGHFADLRTFMCDGVVSKLDKACLWAGLEKLRADWGMDKADLRTFMCGGVANNLENPMWWTRATRIRHTMGRQVAIKWLGRGQVAKRVANEDFVATVELMCAHMSSAWKVKDASQKLKTFLQDRAGRLDRVSQLYACMQTFPSYASFQYWKKKLQRKYGANTWFVRYCDNVPSKSTGVV